MANTTGKSPTKVKATTDKQVQDRPAPESNEPVTELAHVDGNTTLADMKEMSGATDKDASDQQKDALEGLKEAKKDIQHPDRDKEPVNPHVAGPGSDIS